MSLESKVKDYRPQIAIADAQDKRVMESLRDLPDNVDYLLFDGRDSVKRAAKSVASGEADAFVGGTVTTSRKVIQNALKYVKTDGYASSYFILEKDDEKLYFADCAMNQNPKWENITRIAQDTVENAKSHGITPRVAFLTYSTLDSSVGNDVTKMGRATQHFQEYNPDIYSMGPVQFDTAFDKDIGKMKGLHNPKKINVYIFPNLSSGNIAYKIMERVGGYKATGPLLQGFKKPVNDLSRGCTKEDFVRVVELTVNQVYENRKLHED